MEFVAFLAFVSASLRFIMAVVLVVMMIWWLMHVNVDHDWGKTRDGIDANPLAAGVYYGLRFLALCFLAGLIFS